MDAQRRGWTRGFSRLRERARGEVAQAAASALLSMCCLAGAAAAQPRQYVVESFARRDFVPHVYDQSELVRAYGPGWVSADNGSEHRW